MNEDGFKEVYFHNFCKSCKHCNVEDVDDPCNECLEEPINLYSHKPVKYEEDENKKH
jgi:hypothetical protein